MSPIYPPKPLKIPLVLPVLGWMSGDDKIVRKALERLVAHLGPVKQTGPVRDFCWTDYYEKELGPHLKRCYVAFGCLMSPTTLVALKHWTARIEAEMAGPEENEQSPERPSGRCINLDPGYLDINKLVLASWKEGLYKLYMDRGVWADPVAHWYEKAFHTPDWTFPDIRSGEHFAFFRQLRGFYKHLLRKHRKNPGAVSVVDLEFVFSSDVA
jgi:hypothetical protein